MPEFASCRDALGAESECCPDALRASATAEHSGEGATSAEDGGPHGPAAKSRGGERLGWEKGGRQGTRLVPRRTVRFCLVLVVKSLHLQCLGPLLLRRRALFPSLDSPRGQEAPDPSLPGSKRPRPILENLSRLDICPDFFFYLTEIVYIHVFIQKSLSF